jgi:hypothetical protein
MRIKDWLPRKKLSPFVEEGTLLAKSNLLKRGVVQVVPTAWQVGDMTRAGGNGRRHNQSPKERRQ